jgi:hypothetical protein
MRENKYHKSGARFSTSSDHYIQSRPSLFDATQAELLTLDHQHAYTTWKEGSVEKKLTNPSKEHSPIDETMFSKDIFASIHTRFVMNGFEWLHASDSKCRLVIRLQIKDEQLEFDV